MRIESSDKRVDELLKSNTFVIPRFQRPYSWEVEHVAQFWTDVVENISESYFIGSMVVYKLDRSSLAVVDGQQRLTTIAILLCSIRNSFKHLGAREFAAGLQAYIAQRTRENKTVYVLQTETSYPYLQEGVLKDDPPEVPLEMGREEEAIARAFDVFSRKISERLDEIKEENLGDEDAKREACVKWLCELRDTVFDLNVIVVTLDNEDDAYLIFETLNTRGKDLALSDLIRNHFTKFIRSNTEVDHAKIKWTKVLDTIAESAVSLEPDNFIVHSWQSRFDFVTKAKVFSKFKAQVNARNARDHLNQFMSDSEHWRSIFDQDFRWGRSEKEVAKSLRALRTFKVVQPAPGLLSLIRAYRDGALRYKNLRDAVAMIERFHFAFNAVTSSRSSGGISGMYSSFGRQVFNATSAGEVAAAIRELRGKLQERYPLPSQFDVGFEQIGYTDENPSQKTLVQYILKKVAIFEQQPSIGETDDLTIEHLLPQAKRADGFSDEVIGQVGNLILVDAATNTLLASKSFAEKKQILTKKGYKLPEILLSAKELDPNVIIQNTRRISGVAYSEVWKV